jgi:DNA-binding CsgD family transcriptional regulator
MTEPARTVDRCGCGAEDRHLTRREVQTLLLIAADYKDDQIAAKLGISVTTVHTHIKSMRYKAGTWHRAGLLMRCFAAGVLLPGNIPPQWSGKRCLHLPDER